MDQKEILFNDWKKITCEDDASAFERMFFLLNTRFIRFCLNYVSEKETAEDIVSDVFAKCWLDREKLQHVRNPEVYLLVSIKNMAFNHSRRKSYMEVISINDLNEDLIDNYRPDEEMERKELLMMLDRTIASLPVQCRMIFRLAKEDGMKCAEVAKVLGISVRTVHAQLYRAMQKLTVSLDQNRISKSPPVIRKIVSTAIFFLIFF